MLNANCRWGQKRISSPGPGRTTDPQPLGSGLLCVFSSMGRSLRKVAAMVAELPCMLCKAKVSKSSKNLHTYTGAVNIGAFRRRDGRSWWHQDGGKAVTNWVPSASLPTNWWCWEGKKNVGYVEKPGEGKECQDGALTGLFLLEILSKAHSFPKQTNQSNSHRIHSFIFPLQPWIFLIHGLKHTGWLPDVWRACHSTSWCQKRLLLSFFPLKRLKPSTTTETAKGFSSLWFTIVQMKDDKCNTGRLLQRKCMFSHQSLFKMKGIQNWNRNCLRQET